MANRKVKVSLGGLALAAILTILSPQTTIYAADDFDMTEEDQWADKLMADVDKEMNIRLNPSTSSPVVGKLLKGEIADIREKVEGWTRITIGEITGYVSDAYTICDSEAYAYAMENGCMAATVVEPATSVYREAEEDAEVLFTAELGEQLKLKTEPEKGKEPKTPQMSEQTETQQKAEQSKTQLKPAMSEKQGAEAENKADDAEWIEVIIGDQTGYVKADAVTVAYQMTPVRLLKEACQYSQEDLELLAALLECEAGGTSYEGLLAVASVVMNRMESDKFADTLYGVIYEKHQFTPAMNGKVDRVRAAGSISEDAYAAAAAALSGERNTDCFFFNSARTGRKGTKIGGNVFF